MKSILCFMVFISLLAITPHAEAAPIELGTFPIDSAGWGFFGSAEPVTGVSLGLAYDPGQACLGCGIVWTDGQTGQVDFNAANSPFFSTLASRLTNGVNELVGVWSFPVFPTPQPTFFGVAQFEDVAFGGNPDFIGHHVDLIRLTMMDVDMTITPTADGRFNNEVTTRFNWRFYEDVQHSEVPEPASVTLLLCGAVTLGSVRHFRRRSSPSNRAQQ
jgi:hypothetical protein